jgi:crossover junction endodeoxyribonuclease RuvC
MKILGVDPGIHGGLAIIEIIDGAAPRLVEAIDVPTIGTGAKERVDAIAMRTWIEMHKPQHAYIERAGSMPKQGVASTFKFGRATGSLETVVACCSIPMTIVEPAVWKKAHHLRGGDKESARQRANALLARKKDHQRAEAALIALTMNGGAT